MRIPTPDLVPAARTVIVAAMALSLGSCHASLTSPMPASSTSTDADAPNLVLAAMTPPIVGPLGIRSVRVTSDRGNLVVSIRYVRSTADPGYDPFTPGGWSFQVFLDTDQRDTGYLGYDFLTRDTEPDLEGHAIRVRRTTGGGDTNPGGWGDAVDVVPLFGRESLVEFRVPLAVLDHDDGRDNYRVEFYRTVPCAECGGISYEYVFHVTGTTGLDRPLLVQREAGPKPGLLARLASRS